MWLRYRNHNKKVIRKNIYNRYHTIRKGFRKHPMMVISHKMTLLPHTYRNKLRIFLIIVTWYGMLLGTIPPRGDLGAAD